MEPKFRRRADERRGELLEAALALFARKGFAETTVADVAARAGVTAGTVYRYFPSKDAMLEALILGGLDARAVLPPDVSGAGMSAGQALRQVLRAIGQRLSQPGVEALPRLILREVPTKPQLAALYRDKIVSLLLPALAGLIGKGIADGEFRQTDPELAARTILGGLAAHVILAGFFDVVPEGGIDMARFVENHADIVLGGLEKRR